MLDFSKVLQQIEHVGSDTILDAVSWQRSLINAKAAWEEACQNVSVFEERLVASEKLVLWPVCEPLENFSQTYPVEEFDQPITVVGVDGSQIMPSHHEIYNCYLLNIGRAVISYGVDDPAILDSTPRLYHRSEDLYPLVDRRRVHIDELYIALERYLLELDVLADTTQEAQLRGLPVVALVDGSLLPWSAEKMSSHYLQDFLKRLSSISGRFRKNGIPLIGYLSHSRSSDLVNALRLFVCPYEKSDCRNLCGHLNEEDFPCSAVWPLTDRQLLSEWLNYASRSAIFQSGASVSRLFSKHDSVCFTYLHVGEEIARLELPFWLVKDREKLATGLSAVLSQVKKGQGYPICLSEAHHLAVVKGPEREQFFSLLAKHLASLGGISPRPSPKESRKKTGFV